MIEYINARGEGLESPLKGNFIVQPNTPWSLSGNPSVHVDGKIYTVSGGSGTSATASMFSYDIATKTYDTNLPDAPWAGYLGTLVYYDGYLYLYGGRPVGTTAPFRNFARFDLTLKVWESLPQGPVPLWQHQAFIKDDKMYLGWGIQTYAVNASAMSNTLQVYDFTTQAWSTFLPSNAPTVRTLCGMVNIGDKYYIAGGREGSPPIARFEVYDFETDSWESLAPLPEALYSPNLFTLGGDIYLMNGAKATNTNDKVYRYKLDTNIWEVVATNPYPRYISGFVKVGTYLYQVAGAIGNSVSGAHNTLVRID